jgi:polyhydroxyalkanoate synthesis regulator protein
MINSEKAIELLSECIESNLSFISDAMKKTWREAHFSPERNKYEEKWRLKSIQDSKDQIKFCQETIKKLQNG